MIKLKLTESPQYIHFTQILWIIMKNNSNNWCLPAFFRIKFQNLQIRYLVQTKIVYFLGITKPNLMEKYQLLSLSQFYNAHDSKYLFVTRLWYWFFHVKLENSNIIQLFVSVSFG